MASNASLNTAEPASPSKPTVDKENEINEPSIAATCLPHEGDPSQEDLDAAAPTKDEKHNYNTSSPRDTESTENRLRPAADVINRIIWDERFDSADYIIGYEDRFEGRLEASLASWRRDLTDEEFIPQHRILYIKRKSDHEVVWDRRRRVDKIFNSGNSAYSWLAFLT